MTIGGTILWGRPTIVATVDDCMKTGTTFIVAIGCTIGIWTIMATANGTDVVVVDITRDMASLPGLTTASAGAAGVPRNTVPAAAPLGEAARVALVFGPAMAGVATVGVAGEPASEQDSVPPVRPRIMAA